MRRELYSAVVSKFTWLISFIVLIVLLVCDDGSNVELEVADVDGGQVFERIGCSGRADSSARCKVRFLLST